MPDAWQTCRRILAQSSRSFDWASRLLPREKRDEIAALYAWCRRCDDGIDLVEASRHHEALAGMRARLEDLYRGAPPSDALDACLQIVVKRRRIPIEYPHALLDGLQMDVDDTHYESLEDLLVYCWRVAGAVGPMMCHVLGVSNAQAIRHAAHLGIAMQLTNIARDVAEDWSRRRVYLPKSSMSPGLRRWIEDHASDSTPPAFPERLRRDLADTTRTLLERAELYYASADRGLAYLEPRSALAIRSARMIYAEIGRVLERRDCDVSAGRASVSAGRKLALTARALVDYAGDRRDRERGHLFVPNGVLDAPEAVRLG